MSQTDEQATTMEPKPDAAAVRAVKAFAGGPRAGEAAFVEYITTEYRELVEAADEALNCLIACVVPAGGCDDRKHMLDAQAHLRSALRLIVGEEGSRGEG